MISEMFVTQNLANGETLATTSAAQKQLRPLSVAELPRLCLTLWEHPECIEYAVCNIRAR